MENITLGYNIITIGSFLVFIYCLMFTKYIYDKSPVRLSRIKRYNDFTLFVSGVPKSNNARLIEWRKRKAIHHSIIFRNQFKETKLCKTGPF